MKTSSNFYAGMAAMAISLCVQAYPGESIVRDPATGNYTITYRGDSGSSELSQTVFVPSTKIEPTIRSGFRLGEKGVIAYRYSVSNGTTAKQPISGFVLEQIVNPILGEIPDPVQLPNVTRTQLDAYHAAEAAALVSPVGWGGSISRDMSQIDWMPKNRTLYTNSIYAGRTQSGFGFNSLDLPGMSASRIDGLYAESEIFGFPDDGPLQDSAILAQLNQLRDNDFIRRNAAVPTIAVPVPFDAAILLDRIRTQMNTWPAKKLLDPAYAAQLDRYLAAAADAYRHNQPKAGKEHIETLRKMLAKEHHGLEREDGGDEDTEEHKVATRISIDRLAARVLDFDLRYVLKHMESGGDGREQHKRSS